MLGTLGRTVLIDPADSVELVGGSLGLANEASSEGETCGLGSSLMELILLVPSVGVVREAIGLNRARWCEYASFALIASFNLCNSSEPDPSTCSTLVAFPTSLLTCGEDSSSRPREFVVPSEVPVFVVELDLRGDTLCGRRLRAGRGMLMVEGLPVEVSWGECLLSALLGASRRGGSGRVGLGGLDKLMTDYRPRPSIRPYAGATDVSTRSRGRGDASP